MFHVKHRDGPIAAECFGAGRDPDWRVERRTDGTLWWVVVDWQGEIVANGVRATLGDALVECVRWSCP